MAIIRSNEYPFCGSVRKKLGRAGVVGAPEWHGIYQQRKCKTGIETVRMKFYKPTNPNTPAQQHWREKFAQSILAWRALTDDQKKEYNRIAGSLHMSGYNLFQKQYLLS
jgi:hypothetical protein